MNILSAHRSSYPIWPATQSVSAAWIPSVHWRQAANFRREVGLRLIVAAEDKKRFLFRTSRGHGGTALAEQPMTQVDWRNAEVFPVMSAVPLIAAARVPVGVTSLMGHRTKPLAR
jgi:hypothetical protein